MCSASAYGTISTVAGTGVAGFSGDGGPATSANLNFPLSVTVDANGNLFISDALNYRIRKIAKDGTISTVAGTGTLGYSGDGGPAIDAQLNSVFGIAVDATGNLYFADANNYRIRKVGLDGMISTVAGTGTLGFSGDGGPAVAASLDYAPGIAVNANGDLFIADSGNSRIRKVSAGIISTVAGSGANGYTGDGGPAINSTVRGLFGLAIDATGSLYAGDDIDGVVRRIDANGVISTVAGNGFSGFTGDGGLAINAELNNPAGIAVDSGGNLYIADMFNQRIRWVPRVGAPLDTTLPIITPTLTGTQGTNGWYTSNVTVSWTVTDPLAPIISQTGCASTTISADTTGQTLTCSATGQGGTTSQSVTIKRDATAPIAAATPSPGPNINGWNNSAVTVNFTASDSTSGVASCSPAVTLSTEGLSQTSSSGTCVDNAGNVSAAVKASGINIDKTAPFVSGSKSPSPNAAGWNNTPVTLTFTATDALSGVAANGCGSPTVVSSNGAAQSATGQCTDKAGNVGNATVTGISIDTIAPSAVATRTPAPNANGWNNTNVTVSFSGTDNVSGSGIASCSAAVILSAEGSGETASGSCTDVAGNVSAAAIASPVNIDKTPPTVLVTTPAVSGAVYAAGAIVNAVYSCGDAGTAPSGIATCAGTTANGAPINTTGVGTKSYSVTATDKAGNTTQSTVSYLVSAAAHGFVLSPNPLAFGTQTVNVSSSALAITLTSTGTSTLSITSIGVTGGNASQFTQTNNCGASVTAGATCTINVVFTPTSTGAKAATISVNGGAAGTKTVALTGTGVAPTVSVGPATLSFASDQTGVASAPQSVTVTNATTVAVPITSISVGGSNASQFTETNTCGTSVAAASSCAISVVFKPTSTGAKSATLSVKPGGGAATLTVALSGTGIVPTYSVTPDPLAFGNQAVGVASSSHTLIVTNTGTLALPITAIALSGGSASQFTVANTCGASLAAGSTCAVTVIFTPTSAGNKSTAVRVTAGGGAATLSVPVTGTGIVPTYTLSPATLAFGSVAHNTLSAAQSITLTNAGTLALPISNITLIGTNAGAFIDSSACGSSVAIGTACSISVQFKPASTGAKVATLHVTTGGGASTQSIALSGTGT